MKIFKDPIFEIYRYSYENKVSLYESSKLILGGKHVFLKIFYAVLFSLLLIFFITSMFILNNIISFYILFLTIIILGEIHLYYMRKSKNGKINKQ